MRQHTADRVLAFGAKIYSGKRIAVVPGGRFLPSGPVVFAPNHPTTLDPVLLALAIRRPFSCLITESAFRLPLIGAVLRAGGHLPVGYQGQEKGPGSLVRRAAGLLGAGRSVAVFPEGCLSSPDGLAPLHSGTVRIAASARVPVVPVGIAVDYGRLRAISATIGGRVERGRYHLRGWYVVRFGEEVSFDLDPEDREAVGQGSAALAQAMARIRDEAKAVLGLIDGWRDSGRATRPGIPGTEGILLPEV